MNLLEFRWKVKSSGILSYLNNIHSVMCWLRSQKTWFLDLSASFFLLHLMSEVQKVIIKSVIIWICIRFCLCLRMRSKWSKRDSFASDCLFTFIQSVNQCIDYTFVLYTCHNMHFISHTVWNVARYNFSDLQTDRWNQFLNVRRITEQIFLKLNLQTLALLIYVSRSSTWHAHFHFLTIFFDLHFNQFESFSRSIFILKFDQNLYVFLTDDFGAISLIFRIFFASEFYSIFARFFIVNLIIEIN